MQDLLIEQKELIDLLNKAIDQYRKRGEAFALARHDYEIAKGQKMLLLRAEGYKETTMRDIALGDEEIAAKRMSKDIALSSYESCREAINVYKLRLRIVEAQLNREWGKVGN